MLEIKAAGLIEVIFDLLATLTLRYSLRSLQCQTDCGEQEILRTLVVLVVFIVIVAAFCIFLRKGKNGKRKKRHDKGGRS